jgi:hypothetical protein
MLLDGWMDGWAIGHDIIYIVDGRAIASYIFENVISHSYNTHSYSTHSDNTHSYDTSLSICHTYINIYICTYIHICKGAYIHLYMHIRNIRNTITVHT